MAKFASIEWLRRFVPGTKSISRRRTPRPLRFEPLEPRLLLSADNPLDNLIPTPEPVTLPVAVSSHENNSAGVAALPAEKNAAAANSLAQPSISRREVAFVDTGVAGYEQFVADLTAQRDSGRAIDIYLLDTQRDGIEQISEVLANTQQAAVVHVISHGAGDRVQLGAHWLELANLDGYKSQLQQWQSALAPDGDILFYGCELAQSVAGQQMLRDIAQWTGADVAASVDLTGTALFGGNWQLEYATGAIETQIAPSAALQAAWENLLATLTVTTTNDVVNGNTSSIAALIAANGGDGISLREAIIAANSTPGADTIILPAGTFTLTLGGQNENGALTGDLDIKDSLTIVGAGANSSIIDANGIDRVIHVQPGISGSISDLTIRGGTMAANQLGAGTLVDNGASLDLTRVVISGNSTGSGAGIYNYGTLTAIDTTIGNNTAADWGGGLYNDRGAVTLNRVTIDGNAAGKDGGGINNTGSGAVMSLVNTTISGNTAVGQGGGLWTNRAVTATNVTIALNDGGAGDGVYGQGGTGTIMLKNSILYNPAGANTNQPMTSLGNNIDSDGTAGLAGSGDQVANPLLAPLQNNGGHVSTHGLLAGSRAIDGGTSTSAPTIDARSVARDGAPDIGAYEVHGQLATTSESRVNTTTSSTQITNSEDRGSPRAVAIADDGSYVVVWSSNSQDGSGWGVYGQRFSSTGSKVGSEFQINQAFVNDQHYASVAMNGRGDFVVTWTSAGQDGSGNGIYARRYDATGSPVSGEFRVNVTTSGDQDSSIVAMAADGRFLFVWEGNGTGDSAGIFGRWYDSSGIASTSEVRINSTTSSTQGEPSVAMAPDGRAVIVWSDSSGIHAQRYTAAGAASGSAITVDSAFGVSRADVEMAADGRFAVVWQGTVLGEAVFLRRYDAAGSALGAAQIVNTSIFGNQGKPSLAMDDAGNFLVVWEGDGVGDDSGVFGRRYDSNGNALAAEFLVNQTTSSTQWMTSAAMLDASNYVVVWSGDGPGDSNGVFARQFGVANTAPVLTGANNLNPINEDPATNNGTLVSALISGKVTDPDSGALSGIAVTAVVNTNGTWQYSTNGGGAWNSFGAPSEGSARLLAADGSTYVRFVPNADWNGTVTGGLTFRAWDRTSGAAGSTADTTTNGGTTAFSTATASASITVNSVNDAPAGTNNTVTTNEDTPYVFSAANFGFTDPNDAPANGLSAVRIASLPTAGTLTNNGAAVSAGQLITLADINAGLLVFTPVANASATGYASFSFQVQDDGGTANGGVSLDPTPNTMTINVTAVNDAPAGTHNTVTTNEDAPYTFTAANFGFTDPNDAPANTFNGVKITTLPGAGALTNNGVAVIAGQTVSVTDINAGRLVFTPVGNASGAGYGSFTFQVQDNGGTANGGVDLDPTANTMTVNVTAVNDAPVLSGANNLNAINEDPATNNGTLVSALISGKIADADSGALTGIAVTAVVNTNGTWQYSTNSGGAWNNFGAPSSGVARLLVPDASTYVRFVPNANWNGTVSGGITFRAWDRTSGTAGGTADTTTNGGTTAFSTATASASITVNSVNDAPAGTNNTVTTNEDTPYTFTAANFGFTDPNDSPANSLNAVRISTLPSAGTLTNNGVTVSAGQVVTITDINAGRLVFTPVGEASGVGYASFTFQVRDNGGTANGGVNLDQSPNTMTINVTAVNDAPQNTMPTAQITAYNAPLTFSSTNGNRISIADADVGAGNLQIILTSTNGTLRLSGTGGLSFTVGDGTDDATMTFTGNVTNVNAALNGLRFTPDTNFIGSATITLQTNDQGNTGSGGARSDSDSVNITVNGPVPLLVSNDAYSTTEDLSLSATSVLGNDTDPALGTMSVSTVNGSGAAVGATITLPSGALLTMNANGTFTYDPNGVFDALPLGTSVTDSFTYDVGSTSGGTGSGTVVMTINGLNDAPVLSGGNNLNAIDEDEATNNGTLVSALISGQVSDVDGGAFSGIAVTAVNNSNGTWEYSTNGGGAWNNFGVPSNGAARLLAADADTYVRFVPNGNWNGTVTGGLTFRAWDQTSGSAGGTADITVGNAFSAVTASVSITVDPINDAPAGTDRTITINEDNSYTFAAADFGFSDSSDTPGDSLLAVHITALPTAGTLTINNVTVSAGQTISIGDINAGHLMFTPGGNENGTGYASFTFEVQDDGGTANGGVDLDVTPNTITLNVTAVNDAPVGTDKTVTMSEDGAYVFSTADFGFSDADDVPANTLSFVKITTLPGAGTLTNNGSAVSAAQSISIADINAGRLVFTPAVNANGAGYASFTFQVQDTGDTANGGVNLDPSVNTMTVDVTARNDAPILAGANSLNSIDEDEATNNGTLVAALISGQVTDADGGTFSGIAVTAVNNSNGTWQYSTNSGGNWNNIVGPSASAALLLAADSNTSVRFVPNSNWSGTVASGITFRAWDQTSGSAGGTADTIGAGGISAFSLATASASITVDPINDAPAGTDKAITINEDSSYTFSGADFGFSDGADSPANALLAVRIASLPGAGTLTVNGVTVSAGQSVSVGDINAGRLRFTPAADSFGIGYASFNFEVQDDGGTANGGGDLDPTPNAIAIEVTSVNDAPSATNLNAAETYSEDTPLTLTTIVVSDVDNANVTATLTLSDASAGALSVGASGSVTSTYNAVSGVWQANGALADVNALLATVSFVPTAEYSGNFSIATRVDDGIAAPLNGNKTMTGVAANDTPVLGNNSLAIAAGGSVVFSGANLSAADADNVGGTLSFGVSSVLAGQFELVAAPGVAITSFSQAQVTGGSVRFVHDGTGAAPSYLVTVSDGASVIGPYAATIDFTGRETVIDDGGSGGGTTGVPTTPPTGTVTPVVTPPPTTTTGPTVAPSNPAVVPGTSSNGNSDLTEATTIPVVLSIDPQTDVAVSNVVNAGANNGIVAQPQLTTIKEANRGGEGPDFQNDPNAAAMAVNEVQVRSTTVSVDANPLLVLEDRDFVQTLNKLRGDVDEELRLDKVAVGSSLAVTTGLSIGYVLWLVRGEVLLASLLASLPAWRLIDPLPVLAKLDDGDEEDDADESFETVVTKRPTPKPQIVRQPARQAAKPGAVRWRLITEPAENEL